MFNDAKVGDKVWSIQYGWGGIVGTMTLSGFPIGVEFSGDQEESYTYEGESFIGQVNPTLFWDEIKFDIPERPKRKVVKEQNVIVEYNRTTDSVEEVYLDGDGIITDGTTKLVRTKLTYEVEE